MLEMVDCPFTFTGEKRRLKLTFVRDLEGQSSPQ